MCNNFAHLHQHTTYSFLDGAAKIKDLIEWVKATSPNNPTVAVTDHASLHSVPEFYKTAIKNGVKPIIGFEPYIAIGNHRDKGKEQAKLDGGYYHLTLLAENFEGYQNLARLSTLGYTEGFYKKPRISLPLLSQYKKGIICLSGCLGAEIPRTLLDKGLKEGEEIFKQYLSIFRDKFFVELQNHRPSHAINPNDSKLIELVDEQTRLNQMLRTLALKYGVGMVATNDGHYVKQEDAAVQEALLAVQTKTTLSNPNRWKFACDQFYVKSPDEMAKAIPENEFEGAISNTMLVADMCNVELPIGSKRVYHMPSLELEASPIETVRRKAYRGARERYSKVDKALRERIEYELSVIEKTGFPEYFLVLEDAISWAKSQGIRIGLARGSAAASVVCYCLGIINLDPIRWNLYFERFLNEHRISQPDIDLDIQDDRREELVNYLREKYGHDRVSYIGTFGQMSSKAAIKDAARVLEVDWREAEKFTKLIPSLFGNVYSIDEAMEAVDELKEMYNNGAKEYIDLARKMEGLKRQAGIHAAGVIISDIPITDLVPLFRRNDVEVSQYDMNGIEDFGFVKMDFLGLRTLSLIQKTMDWIGQEVDMPLNDKKAMQIFCDGKTTGIFQMESAPMTDALVKLQPRSVEALFALNALYRPGPMDYLPTFIKRYRGEEPVEYKDFPVAKERLAPILEDTMGLIVMQEQVMEICVELASYSLPEADIMRKIIGKKQVDKMPAQKEKFVNGCVGNGIPKREAEKLFSTIEKFAAYSFNLGHSTAYGLTAYQTAYLKAHYPTEFMAAFLTTEKNNTDKLAEYAKSAAEVGVQVLPPDINKSYGDFTPVDGEVRWGLNGIKNVGKDVVDAIIEERKKGLFSTFKEFCFRMQEFLNKRSLEYLIKAGCFDKMSDKQSLLDNLDFIVEWVKIERIDNPLISIDSVELTIQGGGIDSLTDLFFQKEAIGMFINGHPNHYVLGIRESRTISVRALRQGSWWISGIIENITKKTTRSGKTMAILTVSDETGSVELVAYSDTFDKVMEAGENTLVVLGVIQKNSHRGKQTLVKEVVNWKDKAEQGLYVVNASDVPKDVAALQQDRGSKLAINVDDKWLYETDYWIDTSSIKGYYVIDVKERVINEW